MLNKTVYKDKIELLKDLIEEDMAVLDVGFWGQGIPFNTENWPHRIIYERAGEVYGLDIQFSGNEIEMAGLKKGQYFEADAEKFDIDKKFDLIFAGDLIEHLSNPGLFLESCKKHLKTEGWLVFTTPNTFSLYNMAGKLTRPEPVVNKDHTCYLNSKTLKTLLAKNGFDLVDLGFLYSVGVKHKESLKKKFLNVLYWIFSKFTTKFMEDLVVVAKVK